MQGLRLGGIPLPPEDRKKFASKNAAGARKRLGNVYGRTLAPFMAAAISYLATVNAVDETQSRIAAGEDEEECAQLSRRIVLRE